MPIGFTKENQDLVIERHNGRLEDVLCLSLLLQIQFLHYFVSSDQMRDRLKTFKDNCILLHVRDRDLRPMTLEKLARSYLVA